ncbi:DUF3168 domain-containing protein [Erwinia sp. QL-Z3]|uniref:tail completion protein gp17 n=1 Tax=Erwinia sp. QL-Z3 TaxID=2547962 RepID=UPI0010709690|nr:DUF3168 domain-containing protein [Erwinia sp. QL-Z3]QBR52660.1 DUF3168 domain-containing protein [Erwinia sp. QL-Z3]
MIAPIFSICSASPEVNSLIGGDTLRLYPFGIQDDNVIYPYVVWQNISGSPENYLAQQPDTDSFTLQVDAYADTAEEVIAVAAALRNAIEPYAYLTRWGSQEIDSETKRYRYSFDVDWIVTR